MLCLALMAQGWNFIGGYTGYVSFGHVTFFGIGAYVAAMRARFALTPSSLVCEIAANDEAVDIARPPWARRSARSSRGAG